MSDYGLRSKARDPDAILRQIVGIERRLPRAIRAQAQDILRYAAGVGKTYAMLEEAHAKGAGKGSTWSSVTSNHTRADSR